MPSVHRSQLRLQQVTGSLVNNKNAEPNLDANSLQDLLDHMSTAIKNITGDDFHNTVVGTLTDDGSVNRITYTNGNDLTLAGPDGSTEVSVSDSGVTITGDLTVNGTTTTVNTDNLIVEDPLILLGNGNASANNKDMGFVFEAAADQLAVSGDIVVGSAAMANNDTIVYIDMHGDTSTYTAKNSADAALLEFNVGGSAADTLANFLNKLAQRADIKTQVAGSDAAASGTSVGSGGSATTLVVVNTDSGASGRMISLQPSIANCFSIGGTTPDAGSAVELSTGGTAGKDGSVGIIYNIAGTGNGTLADTIHIGKVASDGTGVADAEKFDRVNDAAVNMMLMGDGEFYFRDSGIKLGSSVDGQLDIDADGEVELTSPIFEASASTRVELITPFLKIGNGTTNVGKIQLMESDVSQDGSVSIDAPASVDSHLVYTLPATIVAQGFMKTDANGDLSFADPFGDISKVSVDIEAQFSSGSNKRLGDLDSPFFLNPPMDLNDQQKALDFYVNGQLLHSGSDNDVGAGRADYVMHQDSYAYIEVLQGTSNPGKPTFAIAGNNAIHNGQNNRTITVTANGTAGGANLSTGLSSADVATQIVASLVDNGQADQVDAAKAFIASNNPSVVVLKNISNLGAITFDAQGTGVTVLITPVSTSFSAALGFDLEPDDTLAMIRRK